MARHLFPLNDLVVGIPSTGLVSGVAALVTHGQVIELFEDLACTRPLNARDAGNVGAITSITVDGVTAPRFLGPDSDTVNTVYGRRQGTTGNGFPLYRIDALGSGSTGGTGLVVIDNGDGTLTIDAGTGGGVIDNGDGTLTLS